MAKRTIKLGVKYLVHIPEQKHKLLPPKLRSEPIAIVASPFVYDIGSLHGDDWGTSKLWTGTITRSENQEVLVRCGEKDYLVLVRWIDRTPWEGEEDGKS